MFMQILVPPEDSHFQLILWISYNNSFQAFALNIVTYGLRCLPFLAVPSLLQLASDKSPQLELALEIIKNKSYIDNSITGSFSIQGGKKNQQELVLLLK